MMVVFIDLWRIGERGSRRRTQEIERLDSWNLTNKLDLRAFQTLENDELRVRGAHVCIRTLIFEIMKAQDRTS